jgi:hypothetical protein
MSDNTERAMTRQEIHDMVAKAAGTEYWTPYLDRAVCTSPHCRCPTTTAGPLCRVAGRALGLDADALTTMNLRA